MLYLLCYLLLGAMIGMTMAAIALNRDDWTRQEVPCVLRFCVVCALLWPVILWQAWWGRKARKESQ